MLFLAYLFAVLKSTIYGLSIFFTKSLTENVDVIDILALRFLLSFVVISLWTVDFETPNFFAAALTVALLSVMYLPSSTALSS